MIVDNPGRNMLHCWKHIYVPKGWYTYIWYDFQWLCWGRWIAVWDINFIHWQAHIGMDDDLITYYYDVWEALNDKTVCLQDK